ncbi:hypothetical protein N7520_003431 [Penicillium odoratum]|uniref:uncharacterized protein n=1 Tax=Penicillium odoratum TaxID=1167516 RepID=UPI0025473433|nr:uncharacterized protein N7520_003431 [Penicillium odoratum]KAJ5768872.1 hypothetical protein N7520_003431 [Penicillium odoratum]
MATSLSTTAGPISQPTVSDPINPGTDNAHKKARDPNMSDPRLFVNRPCVYERRLPGDAYITAHVQRLQHGFYSSPSVSDADAEHVDFLAIGFVFHSPHTLSHRFKSATIRVAIRGSEERATSATYPLGYPPGNPRFLMHAPHLIFGTVSPETMQWTFSLAGSLGISDTPVSASLIPSGNVSKQFRRYEMMRIQGSARTLKSALGPQFDVEAGEIVWSLEENNLQRSGLPREFTFVMLIQKPTADSKINLTLDIEPVLKTWYGIYPKALLSLSTYQPQARRTVNFRREVGQKFEPADAQRGFNFAALESSFDHYIAMPGRKFTRSVQIPADNSASQNNESQNNGSQNNGLPGNNIGQSYPQYGNGQYVGRYGNGQYPSVQYNGLNPVARAKGGVLFRENFTPGFIQTQLRQWQMQAPTMNISGPSGQNSSGANSSGFPVLESYMEVRAPSSLPSRVRDLHAEVHPENRASVDIRSDATAAATQGESIDQTAVWIKHQQANDEIRARVVRGKVYEEEKNRRVSRRLRSASASETSGTSGSIMTLANVPLTEHLVIALTESAGSLT